MKTILIVDDKPENLYLLKNMLPEGHTVIMASNGAEALGLARKSPPDLLITDILMPVMDGYTLCKEWRKDPLLKGIPLVFYTATYTDPQDEKFGLSLGADKFILKPQEPEAFLEAIKEFLDESGQRDKKINHPDEMPELVTLREYNQVLIRKLEDKVADSDLARAAAQGYANDLEREIEERKHTEVALKQREEQYRTLVESMNEGLILVDNLDTIIFVNSQFCLMTGYTSEELMGKTEYSTLFKPEDQPLIQAKNLERRKGSKDAFEIELIRKDGELMWTRISGAPVKNAQGEVIGSLGVFEDISEKKKVADLLDKEKLLFQTLAMASPVGIFRTLPDGTTTYVNPKWSELSGLSFEEAIGDGWKRAVHPDDMGIVEDNWKANIEQKKTSIAEYRFLRRDGSIVWVLGNAVPELHEGELIGYVGIITDITERKNYENEILAAKEKAEESNRLKTAFLNNISHEVRTPLNGILGFGELIVDGELTAEEKKLYLEILQNSSERLLKTITDFMDISMITSGNVEVRNQLFSIGEILNQLYLQYLPRATARNLTLLLKMPGGGNFLVDTDAVLLKKILNHLIDNAFKFSNKGTIEIGFEHLEGRIRIFVRDQGIGISEDKVHQIYDHFMQEDPLHTRKFEGSGLGLSIARGLVTLLGGTIEVQSRKGEGATFWVTI
jgi:PAS domain S-box-containing protein